MAENDAEFLSRRRREEFRNYMIKGLDSGVAPRMAFPLQAIRELLSDGAWHSWQSVVAAGVRAGDLQVNTVSNKLYTALTAGLIERRGAYSSRRKRNGSGSVVSDTRELRLIDWPEPT